MKLIGKHENIYLIHDPNRGENTFWFGTDVQDFFVINNMTKVNNSVNALKKYLDTRQRQKTNSSRLLVPLDLDKSKIQWITSGNQDVESFVNAYRETI